MHIVAIMQDGRIFESQSCSSDEEMRIPDYPDGNSGGIRTLNRRHPDTLSINLILH